MPPRPWGGRRVCQRSSRRDRARTCRPERVGGGEVWAHTARRPATVSGSRRSSSSRRAARSPASRDSRSAGRCPPAMRSDVRIHRRSRSRREIRPSSPATSGARARRIVPTRWPPISFHTIPKILMEPTVEPVALPRQGPMAGIAEILAGRPASSHLSEFACARIGMPCLRASVAPTMLRDPDRRGRDRRSCDAEAPGRSVPGCAGRRCGPGWPRRSALRAPHPRPGAGTPPMPRAAGGAHAPTAPSAPPSGPRPDRPRARRRRLAYRVPSSMPVALPGVNTPGHRVDQGLWSLSIDGIRPIGRDGRFLVCRSLPAAGAAPGVGRHRRGSLPTYRSGDGGSSSSPAAR
ncbi:conserved hypothetical protein [Nostocoides japonicum T1-X7]|uniref:Uncharacterized protein n=1 Tax=Nostocoides japonicum T1-X7 TaxID=1194083 RepID=A0A077M1W8_9MICO|nr:conserved hypothetical protein [Tetrasphaera japonica T1-X7]